MSYDLQVFVPRQLPPAEKSALLASCGLTTDAPGGSCGSDAGQTVLRGARRRYSFTLEPSVAVEAEDVPEDVTAVLLGATHLYQLLVEGSAKVEVPHAFRFAKKLAVACGGVVLDPQTQRTWHRGRLRTAEKVQPGMIDIVELDWHTASATPDVVARSWLELTERYLPEALPRRFGDAEPLAMKLADDGPEAFAQLVAREDMVFFKTMSPFLDGCANGWALGYPGSGPVVTVSLSVHRAALTTAAWRNALQQLFVSFADAVGACFASAQVERGWEWSGRSASSTFNTEQSPSLAGRGNWTGLPPFPVWWSWFGPEYAPLVIDHLPVEQVERVGTGLFHSCSEEPLDRDQLASRLTRPSPWLPPDLLVRLRREKNVWNLFVDPAPAIPPGLGPQR